MPQLTDKQEEKLTDLFHQCQVIQQQVVSCLSSQRVGREWQLKMKHSHERMTNILKELKP